MDLGLARAVNSSAIRLWQLKKAKIFYQETTPHYNNEVRAFHDFMISTLNVEIGDLEAEIKNIKQVEDSKKPKNPFGDY